MNTKSRISLLVSGIAMIGVGPSGTVLAQTQSASAIEEITVTTRRREESLTEVPMAISAMTAADFEARDITEIKDIANLTPNFTFQSYAAQRGRRDNPLLLVRGVARNGTGVFVNGAPAGNGQSAFIGELERVEVIKGPQAAYFGRSTFAGAVNFVPRRPSEEFGGSAEAVLGSFSLADLRVSMEGPIVADALTFRASYRWYDQNGQYTSASDGKSVAKEHSDSASAIFDLHSSDNLNAQLVLLYNENNDGVPIFSKFHAADFNCNAGAAPAGQRNYVCGKLPKFPQNRIGADFEITPTVYNVFWNNSRNLPNFDGLKPISFEPGDVSETFHANLVLDYTFESVTLSYLGAYNERKAQFITNSFAEPLRNVVNPFFAGVPTATPPVAPVAGVLPFPTFYIFSMTKLEDMDHEVRIASDQEQPLKGMLGVSYFRNYPNVSALWGFQSNAPGANFGSPQVTTTKTWGVFGNLIYDVTDALTLNFEARYQWDDITLSSRTPNPLLPRQAKDKAFMPRVSAQFAITPEVNAYASFARGDQPQGFNASLFQEPASTVALVRAQTGGDIVVKGEQIDMFELGAKGTALDGRIGFNAAVYYGKWKNQVVNQRIVVPLFSNPALTNILTVQTNAGETKLTGLEADVSAAMTDNLRATLSVGLNSAKIKKYNCVSCQLNISGNPNVVGNRLAGLQGAPSKTANLFIEYRNTFTNDVEWYVNTQGIYSGKIYTDETNLAWTRSRETLDLRAGLEHEVWNIEFFVTNLFQDYYYSAGARDIDIFRQTALPGRPAVAAAFNNAFYVTLPERRQFGGRVKYKF